MRFIIILLCVALSALAEDKPFIWQSSLQKDQLTLTLNVANDCYVYADKTEISGQGLTLAKKPATTEHFDKMLNAKQQVYPTGKHIWQFKYSGQASINIDYQGCREERGDTPGICFRPENLTLYPGGQTVSVPPQKPAADSPKYNFKMVAKLEGLTSISGFTAFLQKGAAQTVTGAAATDWRDYGIVMIIILTLLGGMGLNLTPCILPMIPVNLAILGADGSDWKQGMRRASFYGAGMAAAYGILGLAVVLTGAKFGTLNSSPWFNWGIAGVFLALSLAMFGVFNLDFSGLSAKVDPSRMKLGKNITAFVLGIVAALLAGACVAPVVIAVIVFSSEIYAKGNGAGLLLPFVLGIGMALPWPFAGAGLAVIPRPGQWMERIKIFFGIIIVLAATYYGYLGCTLLPGAFKPDAEFAKLERAYTEAQAADKELLIEFGASWCKNCAEMERNVLPSPEVKEALKRYAVVKFQAEDIAEKRIKSLLDYFKINGLPAFVIVR